MGKKLIIGTVLLVIAIIALAYVLYPTQGTIQALASVEPEVIRIGAIEALSGGSSYHGLNVQRGIDLAVEEINEAGGINGKMLEIIYEDSQCDPKKGITAAKKLIEVDKVSVILGPTCSSVSVPVAPVLEEAKVIMITSTSSAGSLKYAGDYIFRNRVSGDQYSIKIAEFAFEKLNAKTVSILYINLDNGVGYRDAFIKRFEELGGRVLNSEAYEKGAADFRTQILKIKEKQPAVIFIAGQEGNGNAVKQIRQGGLSQQIIGPITIETPELLEVAGEDTEGIIYAYSSFDEDSSDPIMSKYQEKYKKKYGKPSEAFAANAYDAAMLIGNALKKCDSNSDCIRDYLYSVKDYPGAGGLTSFDEFGEVTKTLIIKTVKNGEFVMFEEVAHSS